jgi:hypothetical protein
MAQLYVAYCSMHIQFQCECVVDMRFLRDVFWLKFVGIGMVAMFGLVRMIIDGDIK